MEQPIAWFPRVESDLNEEQKEKIKLLREGSAKPFIRDIHRDINLARWLVAQKWDVDKATQMLIKSMKWRVQVKADTILEDWKTSPFYNFIRSYHPDTISDKREDKHIFKTKAGIYASFVLIGAVDPLFTTLVPAEELYRHHIWIQETVESIRRKQYEESGRNDGLVIVADLAGLTFSSVTKATMDISRVVTEIDASNYPCSMEKTILINVPFVFSTIWNVLSGLISKETQSKFLFLGGPEEYEPILNELFEKENLPSRYGGLVEDAFFSNGGLIADSQLEIPQMAERDWIQTKIGARAYMDHVIDVTASNGTILWEFRTQNYDIGFGLFYKETQDSEDEITLVENTRFNSHQMVVNGFHTVDKLGFYILRFDNTYSFFYAKDLEFDISVS
jgi:hypothetical protein